MSDSLNALSPHNLRFSLQQCVQSVPTDVPLEQQIAGAIIAAANAAMRAAPRVPLGSQCPSTDICLHYYVPIPHGLVAQSVLNRVVAAYRSVGWEHSCIVGDTLVIAREPYSLLPGHGGSPDSSSVTNAGRGDGEDDLLVGHHAGGYSTNPIAAG